MAGDEDWLALQVAASQSPFKTFQRPDAPFGAADPGADSVYTTKDIKNIQAHQGRTNPLTKAFRWVGDKIAGFQANDHPDEHKLSGSFGLSDIAGALAHTGERYSEGVGAAVEGRTAGHGFAGTGIDEGAILVPPQALMGVVPGMRGLIARGEANPISTYDKVRAKLEGEGLLNGFERIPDAPGLDGRIPLPRPDATPTIWPGEEFLPEGRPAWKHQANPFSEEAGRIRGHLQSLGQETWPKAPPFEDSTPLGPTGNMRRLPGEAPNDRHIGEVKLASDSGERLAPFARRTEPLPLTQGVADWLKEAGVEPRVQVAKGHNATDYVDLPVSPGYGRPSIRVPSDGHTGKPGGMIIDTATGGGGYATNGRNRFNAAGEPFSKPDALIDALKWATSSAPGKGNWLVAPGKEPRWARYPKEEPAPKPIEGADFSPDQFKLLSKGDGKMASLVAEGERPIRAYHWTPTPEKITPENRFYPFSHFGTAAAAEERFLRPAGKSGNGLSMADLERQAAEPGSVVGGGTVPVDLHIKNPLRVKDSGEHNPATLAHDVSIALRKAGKGDAKHAVDDVVNDYLRSLPDKDVNRLAKAGDKLWYYKEFQRSPKSDVDWMRDFIGDDFTHNVQERVFSGDATRRQAITDHSYDIFGHKLGETARPALNEAWETLGRVLERNGYDGLVYKNAVEGGGADSYIATKRGTVRSALTGDVLFTKGGDLRSILAAARSDPAKKAAIERTLSQVEGVSPNGIANVLRNQHGLEIHPGDVPEFVQRLPKQVPDMPNQSKPSLQQRVDTAFAGTKPGRPVSAIREAPGFPQRFWDTWDKHAGHQKKVAEELGVSQSTVNAWKGQIERPTPQSLEASTAEATRAKELRARQAEYGAQGHGPGRKYVGKSWMSAGKRSLPSEAELGARLEANSQGRRSEVELERRGGKPFWDENGKAAARESDIEAVRKLFGRRPRED